MTTKIDGTTGVEFPDASKQASAADAGPAFSAYRVGNQVVTNATFTKAILTAEDFDTANAFDSVTNSRFQPTIAGYYQINGSLYGSGVSVTAVEVDIYKNGSSVATSYITAPGDKVVSVSTTVYLNGTTDYVELFGYIAATSGWVFGSGATKMSGFLARRAAA